MDQYQARKRQFGGGFSVTVPIGAGDTLVTLRETYVPPSATVADFVTPLYYSLRIQRLEIVVIGGQAATTWAVKDDETPAIEITGAKSVATSNTRYTYDFGPEGILLNIGHSVVLEASGAGASGYVVVEGYNEPSLATVEIVSVTPDNGTAAGGTSVDLLVVPTEPGCTVFFGDTEATVTGVNETNQIVTVTTPAHAAGAVDISVHNPSRLSPIVAVAGFTFT